MIQIESNGARRIGKNLCAGREGWTRSVGAKTSRANAPPGAAQVAQAAGRCWAVQLLEVRGEWTTKTAFQLGAYQSAQAKASLQLGHQSGTQLTYNGLQDAMWDILARHCVVSKEQMAGSVARKGDSKHKEGNRESD